MHPQDLVFISIGAVIALAVIVRDSIRHDRAKRARLSPGCSRCHGCDSHKCDGSCSVARAARGVVTEGTK